MRPHRPTTNLNAALAFLLAASMAPAAALIPTPARADSWNSGQNPPGSPTNGAVIECIDNTGRAVLCNNTTAPFSVTIFSSPTNPLYVGSTGASVTVSPTVSTSAYASGNCVGSSTGASGGTAVFTLDLSNPTRGTAIPAPGNGYMDGATVTDRSHQAAPLVGYLFNSAPVGVYNDHAACTLASGDTPLGMISFSSYQNDGTSSWSVAEALRQNGMAIYEHFALGQGNTALYLVTFTPTGTPTYATSGALAYKFTFAY